ncbi:MAG TPA: signal peptidase I [Gammaproteobacteria bacterium]|nr:signal peptidase I [Gammaproteobacteria bacterium]
MKIDFQTWMVIFLALCGAIWLFDRLVLAPKRRGLAPQGEKGEDKEPLVVEYARTFFPIILAVLVLRAFIAEPFRIPSGSMMPTLLVGDFILVNKFDYGIRLPVIHKKVIAVGEPQRGDVVVFRYPKNPSMDYIKRIVGLPGDKVAYHDKQLTINGKPVPQEWMGRYTGPEHSLPSAGDTLHVEQLGDVKHDILLRSRQPTMDGEYQVPKGHYFVMGDNRDNSNDSRFWGFVPEQNLIGKAMIIWMNWDSVHDRVRWGRIGTTIK